jgi:hypothetical protein
VTSLESKNLKTESNLQRKIYTVCTVLEKQQFHGAEVVGLPSQPAKI